MTLHSINEQQRLYVMPAGSGFTCLGFDVSRNRALAVAAWLRANGETVSDPVAPVGTAEAYAEDSAVMAAGAAFNRRTGKRCECELHPMLRGLEGRRVEVESEWESYRDRNGRRRFIVGRSTGWIPVHLEIARRDSTGGGAIPASEPIRSVRAL